MRFALTCVVALLWLPGITGATDPGDDGRLVRYHDDRLTVHLKDVPLMEALEELARATGATVRGDVHEAPAISVRFENLPLNDALFRILHDQNFTLIYDGSGQLRTVSLHGGPQDVYIKPGTIVPAGPVSFRQLFLRHPPVSVDGKLAEVLGSKTATFLDIGKVAVQNSDATVRSDALGVILRAIEGDATLKAGVIHEIVGMDDGSLADLARGMAGDRTPEVLAAIAARTQIPELRVRANHTLKVLNRR